MTETRALNEAEVDALSERLLGEVNAAMSCLTIYLGDRLGLLQALAEEPASPAALASRTGLHERYVREWLECLAAGGYIDYDAAGETFSMSPEQTAVLVDEEHPAHATPFVHWAPSTAGAIEPLIEAFRSGGGVPFEAYGTAALRAIGAGNRPMFVNDYVASWMPALPDVEARLRAGGRVADIGCGVGWSAIALAQGFRKVSIDALDPDEASIAQARANATEAGVANRVAFHVSTAEDAPLEGPYDMVTAFECLHDMAYPVSALRRMRELAGPEGAVVVADEAVGDTLEENRNELGHLMYNFSVLHCLPQAMVYPDSAGTGTVMRPSLLRRYAEEAGFAQVEVLPIENPFWRFYRLHT